VLIVISILSITFLLSVEIFKVRRKQPYYTEKMQAAQLMKEGIEALRKYRIKHIGPIDTETDPTNSGLIGVSTSPITSKFGYLTAKQTSINPNWAAVMVEMLKKSDVKEGDSIAMGFSGSFPAINLAALAAAEVLKLKAIPITGVAGSTWGANIPDFTWLDMERIIHKSKIISYRSVAASFGGYDDRALARSKMGRNLLTKAIVRNKIQYLEFESISQSIDARMEIYRKSAKGKRIAAYVNVGGSTVSVGSIAGKILYKPGLNRRISPAALKVDSVMSRFAREGVPIIHMVHMNDLAEKYGLTKTPVVLPKVGEGQIFFKLKYNLYLVATNLITLILVLYVFLKSDIGFRIFGSKRITLTPKHAEPMV
jgi:poly-gamma-glutamate system protein